MKTYIKSFLQKVKLLPLSQEQLLSLNSPFTTLEVQQAIDSLHNNKSPGPDSFTGEYYKTFKHILSPYMVKMYNATTASSPFPSEMLRALIITLPKPEKEPTLPQNFGPISLLNNHLKIYAKLIAHCLIEILPLLIHPDQSGFTNGRQTTKATRSLINFKQ